MKKNIFLGTASEFMLPGLLILLILAFAFISCGGQISAVKDITQTSDTTVGSSFVSATNTLSSLNLTATNSLNGTMLENANITSSQFLQAQALTKAHSQVIKNLNATSSCPDNNQTNIGTLKVACSDGGTLSFSGCVTQAIDPPYTIVEGDYTQTFASCTTLTTIEASDGTCDLEVELTGSVAVGHSFTYWKTDATYELETSWTTSETLDMSLNGEPHEIGFDLTFATDSSIPQSTVSGTVTIDGTPHEITDEFDTTQYTREELGCL